MRVLVAAYTVLAIAAGVELAGVLAVGTWERLVGQTWGDATVWSGYGAGYGWAPLLLPVVALIMLLRRPPGRRREVA